MKQGARVVTRRAWVTVGLFLLAFAGLPFCIILLSPGVDPNGFVARAQVESRLAETLEGKLEFLLMQGTGGQPPAEQFVATIDHGYTAGVADEPSPLPEHRLSPGRTIWLEGSLMEREAYFGEQYLFFGYPQLYVRQIRGAVFWPSQVDRLGTLYLSPLTALASVYLVWAFPFMEEYSLGLWLLWVGRLVLLCLALAAAAYGRKKVRLGMVVSIWVVGGYALLAIVLAVPNL